jgi:DNA uptake protein ComE-like DNA-binding protein
MNKNFISLKKSYENYKLIKKYNTATYKEIGELLGVSRQRVQQIVVKLKKNNLDVVELMDEYKTYSSLPVSVVRLLKSNNYSAEKTRKSTKEDLQKIKGIGPKFAEMIKEIA